MLSFGVGPGLKMFFTFCILSISLLSLLVFRPYKQQPINTLEVCFVLVSLLMVVLWLAVDMAIQQFVTMMAFTALFAVFVYWLYVVSIQVRAEYHFRRTLSGILSYSVVESLTENIKRDKADKTDKTLLQAGPAK